MIQSHIIIVNKNDHSLIYLNEMSESLLLYVYSVLINVTSINKLFLYEETNTVFRCITSSINENMDCIINHSPNELLMFLYDLEQRFNNFINRLNLKEPKNRHTYPTLNSVYIELNPLQLSEDTYFSSINVAELINRQSIRKNLV